MFTAIRKMPHWVLLFLVCASATGLLDASEVPTGISLVAHTPLLSMGVSP